jgi:hypothetical protein
MLDCSIIYNFSNLEDYEELCLAYLIFCENTLQQIKESGSISDITRYEIYHHSVTMGAYDIVKYIYEPYCDVLYITELLNNVIVFIKEHFYF